MLPQRYKGFEGMPKIIVDSVKRHQALHAADLSTLASGLQHTRGECEEA